MKTSVEKGGRMRPIKERDGEIVPDRAMAVVDRVHAEVEEVFDWSVVRWSEKMRETIWPRGRWQQDREEMIWPRGGQGDLEGGGDDQTQFKKREWSVMGGSWATRPVKRWQASCGTISAAQSWQRDLKGAILPVCLGLGRDLTHSLYSLFLLFLSLSLLGVCESENDLKVKQKCKSFSGSKALFYGQSYSFSRKLYFTCAPKHAAGCKIFSGNHLHPKQMHPKLQTRFLRDTTFQLVTNKEDRNIRIFQYSPAEQKTNT